MLPPDAAKRIEIYHAIESGRLDFRSDRKVEWLITWLTDSGIKHLFLDPRSSIFVASEWARDPNDALNMWWLVLEHIHREANLRLSFIAHHTGVSEEAANRARGDSASGDKTDVNFCYRYNVEDDEKHTDNPIDNKRYLSAYGRSGVSVKDFELDFNRLTNMLYKTNSGFSRKDADAEIQAMKMAWKVREKFRQNGGEEINKNDVFNLLGWQMQGSLSYKYGKYYAHMLSNSWVLRRRVGREWLHKPGIQPPVATT